MTSTCMVLLQLQAGLLVDRIRKPAANVRYTFQASEARRLERISVSKNERISG